MEELEKRVAAKFPVLGEIMEIGKRVPKKSWDKLPRDLVVNLDYYLYGFPKRKR